MLLVFKQKIKQEINLRNPENKRKNLKHIFDYERGLTKV